MKITYLPRLLPNQTLALVSSIECKHAGTCETDLTDIATDQQVLRTFLLFYKTPCKASLSLIHSMSKLRQTLDDKSLIINALLLIECTDFGTKGTFVP
jgi:hypothetical protein